MTSPSNKKSDSTQETPTVGYEAFTVTETPNKISFPSVVKEPSNFFATNGGSTCTANLKVLLHNKTGELPIYQQGVLIQEVPATPLKRNTVYPSSAPLPQTEILDLLKTIIGNADSSTKKALEVVYQSIRPPLVEIPETPLKISHDSNLVSSPCPLVSHDSAVVDNPLLSESSLKRSHSGTCSLPVPVTSTLQRTVSGTSTSSSNSDSVLRRSGSWSLTTTSSIEPANAVSVVESTCSDVIEGEPPKFEIEIESSESEVLVEHDVCDDVEARTRDLELSQGENENGFESEDFDCVDSSFNKKETTQRKFRFIML